MQKEKGCARRCSEVKVVFQVRLKHEQTYGGSYVPFFFCADRKLSTRRILSNIFCVDNLKYKKMFYRPNCTVRVTYSANCTIGLLYSANCTIGVLYSANCTVRLLYRANCTIGVFYSANCTVRLLYRANCTIEVLYSATTTPLFF